MSNDNLSPCHICSSTCRGQGIVKRVWTEKQIVTRILYLAQHTDFLRGVIRNSYADARINHDLRVLQALPDSVSSFLWCHSRDLRIAGNRKLHRSGGIDTELGRK